MIRNLVAARATFWRQSGLILPAASGLARAPPDPPLAAPSVPARGPRVGREGQGGGRRVSRGADGGGQGVRGSDLGLTPGADARQTAPVPRR